MAFGKGDFRYERAPGWPRVPPEVQLGPVAAVVVDAQDRIYVHNRSKYAIAVFNSDGAFIRSWGESFEAGAHGLCYNREGDDAFLYLADPERHLVCKTTLDGETLWWRGTPSRPDIYSVDHDYRPIAVAVAPDGDFFVADGQGKGWIHQYDREARYIRSFGGPPGDAPGQTMNPHGLWVDTRRVSSGALAELYVADRGNGRIQVFSLDGQHKRFVTGDVEQPCGFWQWGEHMIVPDAKRGVVILDREDRLAAIVGAPTENAKAPHSACVDSSGNLYIARWDEVVKLRPVQR